MTLTNTELIAGIVAIVVIAVIIGLIWFFSRNKAKKSTQLPSSESSKQSQSKNGAEHQQQKTEQQSTTREATQLSPESSSETKVQSPESSESRLVRLRSRLASSSNPMGKALFSILSRDNLSEDDWQDVEDTLLMADVGAEASEKIVESLRSDARITGEKDPQAIRQMLRERLLEAVDPTMDRSLKCEHTDANNTDASSEAGTSNQKDAQPRTSVIIMVGVNGTGKTTTAGKLGRLLIAQKKKVIMAAADTFRAAAADQLETWCRPVGIEVVRGNKDGADPASVAFEGAQRAKEIKADVLIVDTAGRLQNKTNLMDELGKIRRVITKSLPVDEVLLVIDATTGQNGMSQAQVFAQAIGITGVVLTKLDGSAKGGIVISVQRELGVPVKLVGLGEGPDDLAPFDPEAFVDGIMG